MKNKFTKNNLKTDRNNRLLFTEQKRQSNEYLLQTAYTDNGCVGVNHAT